jgi:hypothetical protein
MFFAMIVNLKRRVAILGIVANPIRQCPAQHRPEIFQPEAVMKVSCGIMIFDAERPPEKTG